MMRLLISIYALFISCQITATEIGHPISLSPDYKVGDKFMGIELLGMLELSGVPVHGLAAHELSALAWDEDDQVLYALSDKGFLLTLSPNFLGEQLIGIELIDSHALQDPDRNALKGRESDAEGMAIQKAHNGIKDDAELLISFEIKPRLIRFNNKGNHLEEIHLPKILRGVNAYSYRNGALESVIDHPELGFLVAPQLPLIKTTYKKRTIHDLKGNTWSFPPVSVDHSSITDLALTLNNEVLILERNYSNVLSPIQIIIRKGVLLSGQTEVEDLQTLAIFDSSKSWRIDNYEGLTHHKDNKFFLISDDNQNLFQSTYLMYFSINQD